MKAIAIAIGISASIAVLYKIGNKVIEKKAREMDAKAKELKKELDKGMSELDKNPTFDEGERLLKLVAEISSLELKANALINKSRSEFDSEWKRISKSSADYSDKIIQTVCI